MERVDVGKVEVEDKEHRGDLERRTMDVQWK